MREVVPSNEFDRSFVKFAQVWCSDAEAAQAVLEALQVVGEPEELAVVGTDNFVGSIGEEKSPIVGRDVYILFGQELIVEVYYHGASCGPGQAWYWATLYHGCGWASKVASAASGLEQAPLSETIR
jgi:hypothetical protein